jgi:heme o synthase
VKAYYYITKPGIIRGNLLATLAGFLLAAKGQVDVTLLAATVLGTTLIIAGAGVCNNFIDRDIDAHMARTKKRASVTGDIAPNVLLWYGALLTTGGLVILALSTNLLTVCVGLIGFVAYVGLYGYAKRRTTLSTLIGGISGSLPPVAGYVAVTNQVDAAAILLFVLLAIWQMPHFFAIGIFHRNEYKAAGLPIYPVVKGIAATKRQIIGYVALFCLALPWLFIFDYTGYVYLSVIGVLSVYWLICAWQGTRTTDDVAWAKKMFGLSISVLSTLCLLLMIENFLP